MVTRETRRRQHAGSDDRGQTGVNDALSLSERSKAGVDRGTSADREPERTVSGGMHCSGRALRRRRTFVHYAVEFFAAAMRLSVNTTRVWIVLTALSSCTVVGA